MAIAFDNSTVGIAEGTDSLTFSHTCTGSDLTLIVAVIVGDDTVVSSPLESSTVTYNGVSMTRAGREMIGFSDDEYVCELWYLDNPATGTNDVVITLSESVTAGFDIVGVAASYTGANNGIGANVGTGSDVSAAPSATFTTGASTSLIVAGICVQTAGITQTPGTGVTEREEGDPGGGTPTISYWLGEKSASGGSDTIDTTQSASRRWAMVALELQEAAGGGEITETVNLVSETDAVQGLAKLKARGLGLASETDLAQAVAAVKALVVGQASETDLAQGFAGRKLLALGQVSETDLAQAITAVGEIVVALNQATETDAALGISWAPKNRLVGQATESDVAQAVATLKRLAVGLAGESDLAQAVGVLKALAVGQATETDLAQSIALAGAIIVAVGQATEADVAQAIGRLKVGGVGQASESDLAQVVARLKALGLGQAGETDAAQGVAWAPKHRLVGQAVENDLALAIALVAGVIQIYTASLLANPSPATTAEANVSPQESVAAQPSPAEEVVSG